MAVLKLFAEDAPASALCPDSGRGPHPPQQGHLTVRARMSSHSARERSGVVIGA